MTKSKRQKSEKGKRRLDRLDWTRAALQTLEEKGIDGVKIIVIAKQLGVTSGSFYWHFSGLRDLLDSVLDYWELTLTDDIIIQEKAFEGSPSSRILDLMIQVIETDAAAPDHAISIWARRDPAARKAFERTLNKRFKFAKWMFKQTGMPDKQAASCGRLMVAYLMGESSTMLKSKKNWKVKIREQFEILMPKEYHS